MEGRNIGIIVAVLVVLAAGWYLFKGTPAQAPTTTEQTVPTGTTEPANPAASSAPAASATVTYTDQGFSPASITVKQGTTVAFVNNSSDSMWVASAVHPDHTAYSGTTRAQHCPDTTGTAFDECTAVPAGTTYTFTFTKVGTWKYHNHVEPSATGSVTVTAQ